MAYPISHTLFHALHWSIHLYKASSFAFRKFSTLGFLGQSHIIIVKAASVFIHIILSLTQKSNFTTSQSINIVSFLGTQ